MRILNLTQHESTPQQRKEGLVDLEGVLLADLKDILTVNKKPSEEEITGRAIEVGFLAEDYFKLENWEKPWKAMIGGAAWFIPSLQEVLEWLDIDPLYAFSIRNTKDTHLPDGAVLKQKKGDLMFRHEGFIEAARPNIEQFRKLSLERKFSK